MAISTQSGPGCRPGFGSKLLTDFRDRGIDVGHDRGRCSRSREPISRASWRRRRVVQKEWLSWAHEPPPYDPFGRRPPGIHSGGERIGPHEDLLRRGHEKRKQGRAEPALHWPAHHLPGVPVALSTLVGPLPDEPYVVAVEAIRKRDSLFERLAADGEWVPERGEDGDMPAVQPLLVTAAFFLTTLPRRTGRPGRSPVRPSRVRRPAPPGMGRGGGLRSDREPKPNKQPNKAPPGGPEIEKMSNTPGGGRTHDLGIRNPMLYPPELRARRCRAGRAAAKQADAHPIHDSS